MHAYRCALSPLPAGARAQLAADCWQQDPALRPTMAQVLQRIEALMQQVGAVTLGFACEQCATVRTPVSSTCIYRYLIRMCVFLPAVLP